MDHGLNTWRKKSKQRLRSDHSKTKCPDGKATAPQDVLQKVTKLLWWLYTDTTATWELITSRPAYPARSLSREWSKQSHTSTTETTSWSKSNNALHGHNPRNQNKAWIKFRVWKIYKAEQLKHIATDRMGQDKNDCSVQAQEIKPNANQTTTCIHVDNDLMLGNKPNKQCDR